MPKTYQISRESLTKALHNSYNIKYRYTRESRHKPREDLGKVNTLWAMHEWHNKDRDENNQYVEDALAKKLIEGKNYNCSVTADDGTVYKIKFYQEYDGDGHHFQIDYDCFAISTPSPLYQRIEYSTLGVGDWRKSASCKNDFPLKKVLRLFCKKILGDEGEADEVLISAGKAKLEEEARKHQLSLERIALNKQEEQQLEKLCREMLIYCAKNIDCKKMIDYSFNFSRDIEQKLTPYLNIVHDEKIYDFYFFIYNEYFFSFEEGYTWDVGTYHVCLKERGQDETYFRFYMEKAEPHRYFKFGSSNGMGCAVSNTMAIDILTIALQHIRKRSDGNDKSMG